MSLVEYLYIDKHRLDSYFEQIASSPVAYDKVPVWEASLTLTSPGAKGTQNRFARPFTTHEKITQLVDYLEKERLVSIHTPKDNTWDSNTEFHYASFLAANAFIPPNPALSSPFEGMSLWFGSFSVSSLSDLWGLSGVTSDRSHNVVLILLEDFQEKDVAPTVEGMSAYTTFEMLSRIFFETKQLQIPDEMVAVLDPDEMTAAVDLAAVERYRSGARASLYDGTIVFLSEVLGAEIGTERPIRSLFRVRRVVQAEPAVHVFAYPVFIAAADKSALLPSVTSYS